MEEKRLFADKFMLRLPNGLRDRIKETADSNMRSMNAEIVATLLLTYPEPLDPEAEEITEQFLLLPKDVQNDFIHNWILKNVNDQDIIDGLVPGVVLRKEPE
jgi:hypothetical protein